MGSEQGSCKFCGNRVGNAGIATLQGLWCGECREGRNVLFADLSLVELLANRRSAADTGSAQWVKIYNDVLRDLNYTEGV
jgi:hypothetical protein